MSIFKIKHYKNSTFEREAHRIKKIKDIGIKTYMDSLKRINMLEEMFTGTSS